LLSVINNSSPSLRLSISSGSLAWASLREMIMDVGFYLTHGDNATILTESQQGIDKIRLGFTIVQPSLHSHVKVKYEDKPNF
jgi:hypothetical protein